MAWLLRFSPGPSAKAEPADLELLLSELWDLGTTGLFQQADGQVVAGFETEAEADAAARRLTIDTDRVGGPVTIEPVADPGGGSGGGGGDGAESTVVRRSIDGRDLRMVIQADGVFGHGSHPTSALALDLLLRLPLAGKAVLDVGTGTGVLAVAAAMAGAGSVDAIDIDPRAVEVARANGARNGVDIECSTGTIGQVRGRSSSGSPRRFDVVVINVLLPVHRELAADVLAALAPGASVVTAGYLEEQADDVVACYRGAGPASPEPVPPGLIVEGRSSDGDWVAHRLGPAAGSAPGI